MNNIFENNGESFEELDVALDCLESGATLDQLKERFPDFYPYLLSIKKGFPSYQGAKTVSYCGLRQYFNLSRVEYTEEFLSSCDERPLDRLAAWFLYGVLNGDSLNFDIIRLIFKCLRKKTHGLTAHSLLLYVVAQQYPDLSVAMAVSAVQGLQQRIDNDFIYHYNRSSP